MISILGDRAANVDITWYHWPCNIDITKNRFYMAARIDKIVISELAATDRIDFDSMPIMILYVWRGSLASFGAGGSIFLVEGVGTEQQNPIPKIIKFPPHTFGSTLHFI
jgi:hypothetical protein